MIERNCKFYNGNYHNTHCDAGVCYNDVTPEPDDRGGIAYRSPCVTHTNAEIAQMNEGQRENYERRGSCGKFVLPTAEELAEDEVRWQKRITEVLASIEKGVVPDGVFVCGPSTVGKCVCKCPDSCQHAWNGEVIEDGENGISTKTCSVCGMWAMNHDMWVGE